MIVDKFQGNNLGGNIQFLFLAGTIRMIKLINILIPVFFRVFPFHKIRGNRYYSVTYIAIANLVAIPGIFYLGWQPVLLIFVYWAENIIIGIINILKMVVTGIFGNSQNRIIELLQTIFHSAFFTVHYGGFCFGHVFFLLTFFLPSYLSEPSIFDKLLEDPLGLIDILFANYSFFHPMNGVIILFLGHLLSFLENFIGNKEYLNTSVNDLMLSPYSRIMLLHITIILGGFFMVSQSNAGFAVIIIMAVLKTIFDLRAHINEHEINSG